MHIGADVPRRLSDDLAAEKGAVRAYSEPVHLADEARDKKTPGAGRRSTWKR